MFIDFNLVEILTLTTSLCFILGHNLWLVSGKENRLQINTGDDFPFSDSAVKTERIADFRIFSETGEQKIEDFYIEENSLNVKLDENPKDAFIAAIELFPQPIKLEANKFSHYIKDEDAENFTKPDFIIGKTLEPQRESYAKFAKVLVKNNAEDYSIFTKNIGHRLEIVLLEIPTNNKNHIQIKVLFEGKPLQNLRVSSGAENLNKGRYSFHTRTDENGLANVEISESVHCFIRTHYIRKHSDKEIFDWESFWASVTFWI